MRQFVEAELNLGAQIIGKRCVILHDIDPTTGIDHNSCK